MILACVSGSMEGPQNVLTQRVFTPVFIKDWLLLGATRTLPGGVWTLHMLNASPVVLPADDVALVGQSSILPAVFYEKEWPDSPFGTRYKTDSISKPGNSTDSHGEFHPTLLPAAPPPSPPPPSPPPPSPPPPSPPPPPPLLGPDVVDNPKYSAVDWRFTSRPAIRLLRGQRLAIKSMAFYTVGYIPGDALTGLVLSQLSFAHIEIPAGAILELEDVAIILNCIELHILQQALCSSPDTWSYNPGVVVEGGVVRIANTTSWAPGPDNGVPGTGGQVHWRNVTLTCPGFGLKTPRLCAARAVANGPELYSAARTALVDEAAATVILSVTEDVTLQTVNGIWEPIPLRPDQQLVLLGDPSRPAPTKLDLSGIADAWRLESMTTPPPGTRPVVQLYDVLLVNMPYPVRPNGPISLLAASLPCFGITRGVLWTGVEQLHLIRSTVVVPDPEVDFLAGTAGVDCNEQWPGLPPGSFAITNKQNSSYTPSTKSNGSAIPHHQLAVQQLKLMSEVLMTDCVLMSVSSYLQRPSAVPLLPQLSAWLPELMTVHQDPSVGQWGPGGLAMFLGLQQALADLARCDSQPGYTASRRIWRQHDTTIPPLEPPTSSNALASVTLSTEGALASAATCAVDGSLILNTTTSPPRPVQAGAGRVFADLKGAINRFSLVRPVTLRNLVLYNLAPGEAYPTSVTGRSPPPLRPSDAAWANSSLPLWVFDCARSDADLTYQPTPAEFASLLSPNKQQIDNNTNNLPFFRLTPRLILENVALVVPEREWRAMVAAVLLAHAPDAMRELRLHPRQPLKQPPPPQPAPSYPGQDSLIITEPDLVINTIIEGDGGPQTAGWLQSSYLPILPDFFPQEPQMHAPPSNLDKQPPPLYPLLPESPSPPPSHPDQPLLSPTEPSVPDPPSPSPDPPSPPWPSPHPPYVGTVNMALRSFAAASKVLSYDYLAGELVLAVARHYGWSGTNVTITYKLPADAPAGAKLLSYPELTLPYDELADLEIDLQADFSRSPNPAPAPGPTPKLNPYTSDPSLLTTTTFDTSNNNGAQQWTAPPTAERLASPSNATTADSPTWLVPVVVCMSVLGGALVLSVTLFMVIKHRRRGDRNSLPTHKPAQERMIKHGDGVWIGCGPAIVVDNSPDQQDLKQKQRPEVTLLCENGRAAVGTASCNRLTEEFTLGSSTAVLCIQPDVCRGTAFTELRSTKTAEAYKTALTQILPTWPTVPLDVSHKPAGSMQISPSGLLSAELKLKVENDRYGSGSSDSSPQQGREGHSPVAANVDIPTFLKELDIYFCNMNSVDRASSALLIMGEIMDTKTKTSTCKSSPRQHDDHQNVLDVVNLIQAELRDPDLQLEAMIAHGTFGAVYRGVWRGLSVAVKTMVVATEPDGSREGRQARQRAVLEAAISLSMAHPNVVVTYSYDVKPLVHAPVEVGSQGLCGPAMEPGEDKAETTPVSPNSMQDWTAVHGQQEDGNIPEAYGAVKLYIVQEYCNGGTLRGALDEGMAGCIRAGGLAGMLARHLALDIALGMQHIHSRRIVHGDLKPENVLLVSNNQAFAMAGSSSPAATGMNPVPEAKIPQWGITAKVADFGLSTPLAEGATHASKFFHGTPAYVAPEVAAAGHLSPRADVWSFGVVLVELYYGCSLERIFNIYNSAAVPTVTRSHSCETILKDLMMHISDPDYAALVERCLALEPRQRPDFGELVAALQIGM
ncbi:hypothetical protein Vafri_4863 [Volvox africanus]|nr:hypothetical protein Vafri_4863 [Volvox africanus]